MRHYLGFVAGRRDLLDGLQGHQRPLMGEPLLSQLPACDHQGRSHSD